MYSFSKYFRDSNHRYYVHKAHLNLKRYASKKKTVSKKYSATVRLPRTDFPLWIKGNDRKVLDKQIEKDANFESLYSWQRTNIGGPEYVLHDGPPYANGPAHIGHAINKIVKDIVVRFHLLNGYKIHYTLGWDCHGLPIEMKAISEDGKYSANLSPLEIRNEARNFAKSAIEEQKRSFKTWGLLADMDDCYHTYDNSYVKNQLRQFYNLYEKKLVYRDSKPVYWSPSSRTALAEAELEYNEKHMSRAVTVRFKINALTIPDDFHMPTDGNLYALIWTTTPWTLPSNEAISYSDQFDYCLVKIDDSQDVYLVGKDLVPELEKLIEKSVRIEKVVPGRELCRLKYEHLFRDGELCPFVAGIRVRSSTGTGLVHTAPAHGPDDYVLGLKYNLKSKCLVDEAGCFTDETPQNLAGLEVLDRGNSAVLEKVRNDIVKEVDYEHSYPYDWRTKKPVIFRSSEQWFIDTNALRDTAQKYLDGVNIAPQKHSKRMSELLDHRSNWCISRQRVWGVPIPVLYEVDSNTPIINRNLVEHYCELIDKHGTDFWWTLPIQKLTSKSKECPNSNNVVKGNDILDIWFDSGISWSHVLNGEQVADLYVEGLDQCRGWFQSSLLTSVGLRNIAPYKNIFIHGFAVDDDGHKMSKSLGNVVEPNDIIAGSKKMPVYGIDVLRWWVGSHAVQHHHIPVTTNALKDSQENVQRIRHVTKYLLGVLDANVSMSTFETDFILDRYMLKKILEFHNELNWFYENMKYHRICSQILQFLSNEVSTVYLHVSKDRLYCDPKESPYRVSCESVCFFILESILRFIAPITPHLAEEIYSYHPSYEGSSYYKMKPKTPPEHWNYSDAANAVEKVLEIKTSILSGRQNKQNLPQLTVHINASKTVTKTLQMFSPIELVDILQVSSVTFSENDSEENFAVQVEDTKNKACERCRKFICSPAEELCVRCLFIVDGMQKLNEKQAV